MHLSGSKRQSVQQKLQVAKAGVLPVPHLLQQPAAHAKRDVGGRVAGIQHRAQDGLVVVSGGGQGETA